MKHGSRAAHRHTLTQILLVTAHKKWHKQKNSSKCNDTWYCPHLNLVLWYHVLSMDMGVGQMGGGIQEEGEGEKGTYTKNSASFLPLPWWLFLFYGQVKQLTLASTPPRERGEFVGLQLFKSLLGVSRHLSDQSLASQRDNESQKDDTMTVDDDGTGRIFGSLRVNAKIFF